MSQDATERRRCRRAMPATAARAPPSFWALTLGSVGVVYGDIGTSPLYAFREAVSAAAGGGPVTREIVLGVLSLIVWSLIIVVTLKYVLILLRADNNGEGGTLSLTALAFRAVGRRTTLVLMLGMIGAAMFYGSSLITPALSVLSAVEGLKRRDAGVRALCAADHRSSFWSRCSRCSRAAPAGLSALFGPIMVVWFVAIAIVGGTAHRATIPACLRAINPFYAIQFRRRATA